MGGQTTRQGVIRCIGLRLPVAVTVRYRDICRGLNKIIA
jgi:hypothetical protein